VKHDSFHGPARDNGTDDVSDFVDHYHCQPAQRQKGADQQQLVGVFHEFSSPAGR
jgi:hypothetical protein